MSRRGQTKFFFFEIFYCIFGSLCECKIKDIDYYRWMSSLKFILFFLTNGFSMHIHSGSVHCSSKKKIQAACILTRA